MNKCNAGAHSVWRNEMVEETEQYLEECVDCIGQVPLADSSGIIQTDQEGNNRTVPMFKVQIPTVAGLAVKLRIGESTIKQWINEFKALTMDDVNAPDSKIDEEQYLLKKTFTDSYARLLALQKERLINNGLSGRYSQNMAKLLLMANHGMKERSDVTSNEKTIDGFGKGHDELKKIEEERNKK